MKNILFTISIMIGLASCATAGTDYVYYVVHPEVDKLFAHDPKDDLILSKVCAPNATSKGPCVALMTPVFFQMKQELLELRKALIQCEMGAPPTQ